MEYCDNSNLANFIKAHDDKHKINQKIILIIALDICKGLMEIHKNGIIQRDIKPENIFINKDYIIKIGDFGVSKQVSDHIKAVTDIGTEIYYAPERIENGEYDDKVDIWALGCIIYELCTLRKCFPSRNYIYNIIINKQKLYGKIDLKYYSKDLQNIIDELLEPNPQKRPKIEKAYYLIKNCSDNFNLDYNNISNSLDETSYNILTSHNSPENFEDYGLFPGENEGNNNSKIEMNLIEKDFSNKKDKEENMIDNSNNKNHNKLNLINKNNLKSKEKIPLFFYVIIIIFSLGIIILITIEIIIALKLNK